jgi:hypothetical protein
MFKKMGQNVFEVFDVRTGAKVDLSLLENEEWVISEKHTYCRLYKFVLDQDGKLWLLQECLHAIPVPQERFWVTTEELCIHNPLPFAIKIADTIKRADKEAF